MSDDLIKGALGPPLTVDEWVETLRGRVELTYYCQNGQYSEDALHWAGVGGDVVISPNSGKRKAKSKAVHVPTKSSDTLHGKGSVTLGDDSGSFGEPESARHPSDPSLGSTVDTLIDPSLSPNSGDITSTEDVNVGSYLCTAPEDLGNTTVVKDQQRVQWSANEHDETQTATPHPANFAIEFFGESDRFHEYYHWRQLDHSILTAARDRGLEPTTLGHVLSRRNILWAQIQCIDSTARGDFENHIKLYQRQFEMYTKSGDGWVNTNADHKLDPLFLRKGTYLKGVEGVYKVIKPPENVTAGTYNDDDWDTNKPSHTKKNVTVKGTYDWNNVIFCPNFGDSGEFVRRYARKSVRLYKNLYDCLVHGWVHPGLVVCEVKDATHPIRFSTPPDQDCYTVVYAGPAIPEDSIQRVIFGEYTGIVYREESLEDTVFEYAFELNFSSSSWINADVEVTMDTAEITEKDGLVLLPNNARFVLDSSRACNELSLVNHYQSIKAYGGEMWVVPNCEWQQVFLDGWPHVVLTSKLGVAINPGDELVADFGGLWFSKVEETAHRHIRDELIKRRLGMQMPPTTSVQQFEMAKRPLSKIDIALRSNSTSNANAICAICYNVSDDQVDENTEEEPESVTCDGCDRFFHIHCVNNLNRAAAVYVSKDLLGDAWCPMSPRKSVVNGSGAFYCSFCRHLAKKIYMHDTGCDYMPLSRGSYGVGPKPRILNPIGEITQHNRNSMPHDNTPKGVSIINDFSGPNDCRYVSQGDDGCHSMKDSGIKDDVGEIDLQMEIEGVCTVSIASNGAVNEKLGSLINIPSFMKPMSRPSLFDVAVADERELAKMNNYLESEERQKLSASSTALNPSDSVISNDIDVTESETEHQDGHGGTTKINNCPDADVSYVATAECSPMNKKDLPVSFVQGFCPTCLRNLPKSSAQGTVLAPTTVESSSKFTISKESNSCNGGIDTSDYQVTKGNSNNEDTSNNSTIHKPEIEKDAIAQQVDITKGSVQSSAKCKVVVVSTIAPTNGCDTITTSNSNEAKDDTTTHAPPPPSTTTTTPPRSRKTTHGMNSIANFISTGTIASAVDMFKSLGRPSTINPRFLPPDHMPLMEGLHDTTMVDYLGCKYLAGMWQIEPFALFGDCVRVCTECYSNHGPKANVYICRVLKRHLSGNFDHPMNTNPSQMRELILMAYEQHVQMLLRLLVLKNVAITFMCKLCCHFIGRQLLQYQANIPPLPFPRDFIGNSFGPPEGLLANPSGLINTEQCTAKKLKLNHKKGLESHLSSFVLSIKNAVSSTPVSCKSDPALSYKMLSSMGAFTDEFSRLANCKGIIEYLNDLMSHKVLEADNTPGQLQQTLTKDELRRFAVFRHLAERSPGAFNTAHHHQQQQHQNVRVKVRHKNGTLIPLIGIVPGLTYIYRKFTDGYYNGLITKYNDDSVPWKSTFLVTYSDGDDELMTHDDLLAQVLSNFENLGSILSQLSPNDSRNEALLLRIRGKDQKQMETIIQSTRRDMLRSLTVHMYQDNNKKTADGGKKPAPAKPIKSDPPKDAPVTDKDNGKRKRSADSSSDSEYLDA